MKNIISLFIVAGSLLTQTSFAGVVQKLLTVTSDAKPGKTFFFSVELVDNSMEIKNLIHGGTGVPTETFTAAEIKTQTTVLLWDDETTKSLAVVTLDARASSPLTGGKMSISYLKNGITHKTEVFDFDIDREGNQWVLIADVDGVRKPFNTMFMKKNSLMGKTIGISEIVVK